MARDPSLQIAQRRPRRLLGGERAAELRLAAGTLEEDDESSGNSQRDLGTQILFDQRQRQVDASRDASRGPHGAVVDEHRIGLDPDAGVAVREVIAEGPMGGRSAIVQQAGRGEKVCARAHGHGSMSPLRGAGDPVHSHRIPHSCSRPGPAGDDERVVTRGRLGQRRNAQAQPILHADCVGVRGADHLNPVGARNLLRCVGKDLDRPEHVERLAALDG